MKLSRSLAVGLAAAGAFAAAPLSAQTTTFDNYNFPGPVLPGNVDSQCLECNQLNSLGQIITMTQGGRISSFSFILSSFAPKALYPTVGTATDFSLPITLNIYSVGAGNAIGGLLYSMTQSVTVPYRPVGDPTCGDPWGYGIDEWRDGAGICNNGIASRVTFNPVGFDVGAQFGYTLAFSTEGYGPVPTGATPNPANSLNFGVGLNNPPLLGTVDALVYDGVGNGGLTSYPVADDGPIGDSGTWGSYTLYNQVNVTPEPATLVLLGTGLLFVGGVIRRRRKVQSA
jgi:hypothetical protein